MSLADSGATDIFVLAERHGYTFVQIDSEYDFLRRHLPTHEDTLTMLRFVIEWSARQKFGHLHRTSMCVIEALPLIRGMT